MCIPVEQHSIVNPNEMLPFAANDGTPGHNAKWNKPDTRRQQKSNGSRTMNTRARQDKRKLELICALCVHEWAIYGYIERDSSPPGGRTFSPYIPLPHTHLQRGNVFQTHFTWGEELEKKKLTSGWSSQSPDHQSLGSEWTMWSVQASWVSALHLSCLASELEVPPSVLSDSWD